LTTTALFSPEKIEKGVLSFIGLLSIVIFYLLIEGQIILRFIPTNTKGAILIGKAERIKGSVYRKLKNDSLHLPIQLSDHIYIDDLITTSDQSSLEIQTINHKNSLSIEPNTILRLSQLNNKILLHIHSGSIITHFIEDETILLQAGATLKDFLVRKGTYFIKNSSSGIQITAYNQNVSIKKSYELEDERRRTYKAETNRVEDSSSASSKDKTSQANSEPIEFKMPLTLPFPSNNQVFLIANDTKIKEISLVAKKICLNNCLFKLSCNGKTFFEKEFITNETPYYILQISNTLSCHDFQWKFRDGDDEFENAFFIDKFSNETFDRYLEQNKTIEVL